MQLNNLCAIITGASRGLGYEIAKHFVSLGANVMLCAREEAPLQLAKNNLMPFVTHPNQIIIKTTDISKITEVEALVAETLKHFNKIDILVANAGIHGAKGSIDEVDWQAWCDAIDVNLKGTVLSCRSVLRHFKNNKSGKIVILSGGGATKPMPYVSAYAASKAAVVRFAETLAEEVAAYNIDVNALAPGALNTRLLDDIIEAGPAKVGDKHYQLALKQLENGGTPLTIAAKLCAFLASSKSDGITGKLISAVWDPWENLPKYVDELKNSDIYTLRRIVPEDRGKKWDNNA